MKKVICMENIGEFDFQCEEKDFLNQIIFNPIDKNHSRLYFGYFIIIFKLIFKLTYFLFKNNTYIIF